MSAHSTGHKTTVHAEHSQETLVRFFVISAPEGGWNIFREGRKHPIQFIRNKVLALETAKMMAKKEAPSHVMVERADGSIVLRYNFSEKPPF